MTTGKQTTILGISAFYHDAAALVVDGEIVAAAQEERFTRKKHDPGFPPGGAVLSRGSGESGRRHRLHRLLRKAASKFDRLLETY